MALQHKIPMPPKFVRLEAAKESEATRRLLNDDDDDELMFVPRLLLCAPQRHSIIISILWLTL